MFSGPTNSVVRPMLFNFSTSQSAQAMSWLEYWSSVEMLWKRSNA